MHGKVAVLKYLFHKITGLQETPTKVFSCEYWEIFGKTFSKTHLQTTAFEGFEGF